MTAERNLNLKTSMFASLSQSWEFAKTSFSILNENRRLLAFPIMSGIAAVLVSVSFFIPLERTGQLAEFQNSGTEDPLLYLVLFAFYFANYFVIVFFNSALVIGTMSALEGQPPSVKDCLQMASRRLPQITGWALVSAAIGLLLRALERNQKVGQFVVSLLGMAWTAMTFFVIPLIVTQGLGPIAAVKKSIDTMKSTWGTALTGNFSLGLISFLLMIPVLLVAGALIFFGVSSQSPTLFILMIIAAITLVLFSMAVSSAVSTIFMTVLYCYATGRGLPDEIRTHPFRNAFTQEG